MCRKKPNIIFILADDMGYSDMSFLGSGIYTPNIDKLASEGMYLKRYYTQPQCTPTRVAFLTGRYPYHFGMHEHIVTSWSLDGVPGDVKTIAEKMKEGGYRTAIVGKWHVGGHRQSYLPHNQGFDHSFVCINGAIDYWNYTHGLSDLIRNGEKVYAPAMEGGEASGNTYATEMWKQEAVELIKSHKKKQPLFMYLSFNAPHQPFQAPKVFMDKYADLEIEDYWSDPDAERNRKAGNRKSYMAMVDAMDSAIGEVIEALKDRGMLKNTLLVFSSDNGGIPEADNRPLRSVKGDSFEGGVRVPGIAYWPGKIKGGTTSSEMIYVGDWYATFAEIAGLPMEEEHLDGISAMNVLQGMKGKRQALPIISSGRHAYITPRWSLVGGGEDYNLIAEKRFSNFMLYDLEADISQKEAVSNRPDLVEEMVDAYLPHFKKINRGYFNWDLRYNRDRHNGSGADHNFDLVVNDLPEIITTTMEGEIEVIISPVSGDLAYRLEGSNDGGIQWKSIEEYVSKQDATHYIFKTGSSGAIPDHYRVKADDHFGFPARDCFSMNGQYVPGVLSEENNLKKGEKLLPEMDGFLPLADLAGGTKIGILNESLKYKSWPEEGGALQMFKGGSPSETYLTRYFLEQQSRGRLYASMLVRFGYNEVECSGEINWLRQNGTRTSQVVSLSLEPEGIFLDHTDTVSSFPKTRVANYDGEVVCLLFEFEMGTTGNDSLIVYINPELNAPLLNPVASLKGEFTFDRLQFRLDGRNACRMTVDEIHVGRNLDDVLY